MEHPWPATTIFPALTWLQPRKQDRSGHLRHLGAIRSILFVTWTTAPPTHRSRRRASTSKNLIARWRARGTSTTRPRYRDGDGDPRRVPCSSPAARSPRLVCHHWFSSGAGDVFPPFPSFSEFEGAEFFLSSCAVLCCAGACVGQRGNSSDESVFREAACVVFLLRHGFGVTKLIRRWLRRCRTRCAVSVQVTAAYLWSSCTHVI